MPIDKSDEAIIEKIARNEAKEQVSALEKTVDKNSEDIGNLTVAFNEMIVENKVSVKFWTLIFKIIGFAGVGGGVIYSLVKEMSKP